MSRMRFKGVVVKGRQLGRTLGFPTANIELRGDDHIPDGVYHAHVWVDGKEYNAMSNLGHNPSVGGCERRLETHLFDFEGSLYGKEIEVELLLKIRDEEHFSSIEELREQIKKDEAYILKLK